MWTTLTMAWNKAKYYIIAVAVAMLYLLGYQKGRHKEQTKTMKGTLDNVQKAKMARDKLSNPDHVKRLHNKYKR